MTNRIALWLAAVITAAICLDLALDLGGVPFLMRRFVKLIDWLQFWR
ncbi:hypothetical protein [Falsirhodobacter sp. 20TX0035]|nr:hypothetical protein [Falsirhodobacter sp. 20TX0035]MDB6454888.1 hypothetical protein [Falsirhodobacter sp. 20TX0035]